MVYVTSWNGLFLLKVNRMDGKVETLSETRCSQMTFVILGKIPSNPWGGRYLLPKFEKFGDFLNVKKVRFHHHVTFLDKLRKNIPCFQG